MGKLKIQDVGDVVELKADHVPAIDWVCGLRKVGPSKYSLVTGRIIDGVPDLKVDLAVSQSQDHAAEELRNAFQALMRDIP
jgi:hypothetical protein